MVLSRNGCKTSSNIFYLVKGVSPRLWGPIPGLPYRSKTLAKNFDDVQAPTVIFLILDVVVFSQSFWNARSARTASHIGSYVTTARVMGVPRLGARYGVFRSRQSRDRNSTTCAANSG